MALFNKKTKKGDVQSANAAVLSDGTRDLSQVLVHARITEKATMQVEGGVYTFNVAESATKRDIIAAVRAHYQVTPRLVRIVKVPRKMKRNMRTGKIGMKSGGKKAYVYLKKGETLTIS